MATSGLTSVREDSSAKSGEVDTKTPEGRRDNLYTWGRTGGKAKNGNDSREQRWWRTLEGKPPKTVDTPQTYHEGKLTATSGLTYVREGSSAR